MSRVRDEGFRYCPQDTDTFADPKIRMLIASHGCAGYAVWDYLKLAAYRAHGYYTEWDDCRLELAAADLGLEPTKIGLIIDYLLRRSLLCCIERKTCTSRSGVKVLTSHGIQARFQRMARDSKREYTVDREIWMLNEDETFGCIKLAKKTDFSGNKGDNSRKKGDNSGIMPYKAKQSKYTTTAACACAREERENGLERALRDPKLALCSRAYERNIGTISAAVSEDIVGWLQVLEPGLIVRAIEDAAQNNVRRWAYVKRILERCADTGIRTAEAYDTAQQERRRRKEQDKGTAPGRRRSVAEIIDGLED